MSNNLIGNIVDWFKAAKPEPTGKDKVTQLACVFEEVAELAEACGLKDLAKKLNDESDYLKKITPLHAERFFLGRNRVAILDATSDITVTVQGLNQLMDFDGIGALKEVIRSNNSKMVDGKFIFDENSKIAKPDTFSEPNLKPYLNKH